MEKSLQLMLDAGIDENIAKSMLKSLEPKTPKKKKKTFYGQFTSRKKIVAPVTVIQTCLTCGTETSYRKTVKVYSDETDITIASVTGLCINCIKMFELMDKEQLIALIIIQNHTDLELRQFSTKAQIKMAKERSAQEWLLTKLPKAIANSDKDEEDFVETKSEKEGSVVKQYMR